MKKKLLAIGVGLSLSMSTLGIGTGHGDTWDDIGDEISRDSALERATIVLIIIAVPLVLGYLWWTKDKVEETPPAHSPSSETAPREQQEGELQ